MRNTFSLLLLGLFCSTSLFAQNSRLYVSPDGDNTLSGAAENFAIKTIDTAIRRASAGDTIVLLPGKYTTRVNVSKNVVLVSKYINSGDTSFVRSTIIEGAGNTGTLFSTSSNNSNPKEFGIIGLTIQNFAGVILTDNQIKLTLDRVVVYNSGSNNCNSLFSVSRGSVFKNSTFDSNKSGFNFNMNNDGASVIEIYNCLFYDNTQSCWDALFQTDSGKFRIYNNVFRNNNTNLIRVNYTADTIFVNNNTFSNTNPSNWFFGFGNWNGNRAVIVDNIFQTPGKEFYFWRNNNVNNYIISNNLMSNYISGYEDLYQHTYDTSRYGLNKLIQTNPFVDTASGDFSLKSTSIAIGKVTSPFQPAFDKNGQFRPNPSGTNGDIGAIETAYSLSAPALSAEGGDQRVVLTWDPIPGATSYIIYRSSTSFSDTTSNGVIRLTTLSSSLNSYTVNGLTNASKYFFRAYAKGAASDISGSSSLVEVYANIKPDTVRGLTTYGGTRRIQSIWRKSSATGITYNVYRSKSPFTTYSLLKTGLTDTLYLDTDTANLTTGSVYKYAIRAVDQYGVMSDTAYGEVATVLSRAFVSSATDLSAIRVGSSTYPFSSIASAVTAIQSGDTLVLKAGVFKEPIRLSSAKRGVLIASEYLFTKDTSIIGRTILDGSTQLSSAPLVNDSSSQNYYGSQRNTLYGFTISGAKGLAVAESRSLNVLNMRFTGIGSTILGNAQKLIVDSSIFVSNGSQSVAAQLFSLNDSCIVRNSQFQNNILSNGIVVESWSQDSVIIEKNIFRNNRSSNTWGMNDLIRHNSGQRVVFRNNLVAKNSGLRISLNAWDVNHSIHLINNTIVGNTIPSDNAENSVIQVNAWNRSNRHLYNNIIQGNLKSSGSSTQEIVVSGQQGNQGPGNLYLKYNIIGVDSVSFGIYNALQVNIDSAGGKNFYTNVDFADTAAFDYSLANTNPAIGYGNAASLPVGITDLAGNRRINPVGSSIDLGAYESPFSLNAPTLSIEPNDRAVLLNWAAVQGATSYLIYRSSQSFSDTTGKRIAIVAAPLLNYKDEALTNLSRYYYRIVANASGGRSSGISSEVAATPNVKPESIRGLTTYGGTRRIQSIWRKSSATGITYNVYRSKSPFTTYSLLKTGLTDTLYLDTDTANLTTGSVYKYAIRAVDQYGVMSDTAYGEVATVLSRAFVSSATDLSAIRVGSSTYPFSSIASAVTAIQSGDTLVLKAGVFKEPIRLSSAKRGVLIASEYLFTKDTSIIGRTILDGSTQLSSAPLVNDSSSQNYYGSQRNTLYGFTISGAKGLAVAESRSLNVLNMRFTGIGSTILGNAQKLIVDSSIFVSNGSQSVAAQLFSLNDSCIVRNSQFQNNILSNGIVVESWSQDSVIIEKNIFRNNRSSNTWGMNDLIRHNSGQRVVFRNNLVAKNSGLRISLNAWDVNHSIHLINNTIVGNTIPSDNAENSVIQVNAWNRSNRHLYNNIIQGNLKSSGSSTQEIVVSGQQGNQGPGNLYLKYNIIGVDSVSFDIYNALQVNIDSAGGKNFYTNVDFADTAAFDYSLANTNPAIGYGNAASLPVGITDLAGNRRINPVGSSIDLGAYESPFSLNATSLNTEPYDRAVLLKWAAVPGATSYLIYRSSQSFSDTTGKRIAIVAAPLLYYKDEGLTNLSRYYYRIVANASGGKSSGVSSEVAAMPNVSPAKTTGLVVKSGPRLNYISWNKANFVGAKYNLYVGADSANAKLLRSNLSDTTLLLEDLQPGMVYTYAVKTVDTVGVASYFNEFKQGVPTRIYYVDTISAPKSMGTKEWPLKEIQLAIEKAKDGDSVMVAPGSYGAFRINHKAVTVIAEQGPTKTFVKAGTGDYYSIRVDGNNSNQIPYKKIAISGFTVRGFNNWRNGDFGGAVSVVQNTAPVFSNMIFSDNNNFTVLAIDQSAPRFENCIFYNNGSQLINVGYSDSVQSKLKMPRFVNCTFTKNQNWGNAGGGNSRIYFFNSIIWGNNAQAIMSGSSYYVVKSLVDDINHLNKNGNFRQDPKFVNEELFDFRLSNISPALGKGAAYVISAATAELSMRDTIFAAKTDIENSARPAPSATNVDLGAYENQNSFPAPTITRLQKAGNIVKLSFNYNKEYAPTKFLLLRDTVPAKLDTLKLVFKEVNKDSLSVSDTLVSTAKTYYYALKMVYQGESSGISNKKSTLDTIYIPSIVFEADTLSTRIRGGNALSFVNRGLSGSKLPSALVFNNSYRTADLNSRTSQDSAYLIGFSANAGGGKRLSFTQSVARKTTFGSAGDQMQLLAPINVNFDDHFDFASVYSKNTGNHIPAYLVNKNDQLFELDTSKTSLLFNSIGSQLDSSILPSFSFSAKSFPYNQGAKSQTNIRDAVDFMDGNFDGKQELVMNMGQLKWVPKFKSTNGGGTYQANNSLRIIKFVDINRDGIKDVFAATNDTWSVGYNSSQGNVLVVAVSNTSLGQFDLYRTGLFFDWNASLHIADFDKDGKFEILTRSVNNSSYQVFTINDFTATSATKVSFSQSLVDSRVDVSDMNNDGFEDIITLYNNGNVTIFVNNQLGGFKPESFAVPTEQNNNTINNAFQLKALDLDLDGYKDLTWLEIDYSNYSGGSSGNSASIIRSFLQKPEQAIASQAIGTASSTISASNDGYNVKIKWSGFTDPLGKKLQYNIRLDTIATYANRIIYTGHNYKLSDPTTPIVLDEIKTSAYEDSIVYRDVNISSKYPYYIGVQAVSSSGLASDYKTILFKPKDPLEKQISSLPGMTNAKFAWGDFNNDGLLDLAVTGLGDENTGRVLRIYKNNNGTLVDLVLTNRQLSGGDVKWVDIDKDGWLDLLASGQSGSVPYIALFKNNLGTFEISYPTSIPALKNSTMALGDHDNNGTIDLVIAGQNASGEAKVFLLNNDGRGNFVLVPDFNSKNIVPGIYNADLRFIDYDLDGDLDLIYTGTDNNGNPQGGIRLNTLLDARNAGFGQFSYANGLNLKNAKFDLGDADSDGDLDILVMGTTQQNSIDKPITKLVKNLSAESKSAGSYNNNTIYGTVNEVVVDSLDNGDVKFADINNDGLLDISISGLDGKNTPTTKIYINQGGFGNYSQLKSIELPQFKNTSISWGDYNNDGNMDMVITGAKSVGTETVVYVNDQGTNKNVAPSVPAGLTISDLGLGRVVLKWNPPADDHTPLKSISYIIRIGTKPGLGDLSTIPVDTSGRLQSPTVPVVGTNEYYLELPPGQYYWSVMAIDGNFKNSKFSKEQSFILKYPWKFINQGGIIDRRITPIDNSQFAWADLNNDGLSDFIYLGNTNIEGNAPGGIYRNAKGTFIKVESTSANGASGLNGINNLKNISIKFKDVNNDGFVDLFVAGENQFGNQPVFRAFINKRNFIFTDVTGMFAIGNLLRGASIDFADLDNSGTPDMIYSGTDNSGVGQVVFLSTKIDSVSTGTQGVGFSVTPFQTNIKEILNREQAQNMNLAFTDFNLDKRIDMVMLYDNVDGLRKAEIYNGSLDEFGKSVFVKNSDINLPKVKNSTLDVVDFNKDGFPDVAISGYSSINGQLFKIYKNRYDSATKTYSFVNTQSDLLLPIQDGKTTWGDFNMDGYPDVIFSGNRSGSGYVTKMATSASGAGGAVSFVELPSFPFGDYVQLTPTMGDINGDGQLGVVLVGRENLNGSITAAFKILQNVRGVSANVSGQNGIVQGGKSVPFAPLNEGTAQTGNANVIAGSKGISKLDISDAAFKGLSELSQQALVDDNEKFTENLAPSSPSSLSASILEKVGSLNLVRLSWKSSSDDLTPTNGLTYALRIGKSPGKSDVMDPESNKDGTRKTPTSGNTENNTSWDVQLPSGTYYWSVQAVDASYTGSDFALESTLVIKNDTIVRGNAPSDIYLNNKRVDTIYVPANAPLETITYALSSYSKDSALVTSYSYLINADDDTSSASTFAVDTLNKRLYAKSSLKDPVYDVRVRTTDSRGLAFEKTFKFIVVMPPSNILLDGNNTALLSYSGTLDADRLNVVLTAVDPNFGESNMTYSLVKGVGDQNNSLFDIKGGNKLFNKSSLQLADTLRIRIAVSNGYAAYEKTLKIVSSCQFATVKLLDVKSVVNKICEGQTVDMVLPATGTTVNLFRDNAMISTFTNTSKLQLTLPGKYYAIYSNGSTGCGSKTDSIFVEYNVPVTQITPEGSTTICDNTSVNLSATGATGYTYQWLKNNVVVSGASGTVFQAREAAEYKVKITNSSGCSAVSDPVSVSTKPSPVSVLNVLSDTTICAGSSIMFTVPSGAVNYNWIKDGQPQNNNFSNSLMVNQAASINVIVTGSNGCSSSSQLRRVNVSSNPTEPGVSIISTNTIACAGTPVVLSGQILSGMKYQWLKDGAMIQGANTSNYNATSAGNYQLQIANSFGCSNRSANIDIKGAIVAKPQVTLSGSPIVCEGAKLTLTSSVATGNQWFRDGALIPGAVGNNFVPTQDGRYTVSSSLNGCSSDTSSGIQVKYKSLPIVVVTTSATNICAGANATFMANTNVAGASYQWFKDGVALKNDTLFSYKAVDSGKYSVAVTSEGCSKSSSTIALKVNPTPTKPQVTLSGSPILCEGAKLTLTSSVATGNQWFRDGVSIAGAVGNNFIPTQDGRYTVSSSLNGCSSDTSSGIQVKYKSLPIVVVTASSTSICAGSNATFIANTDATGASYLWYKDGVAMKNDTLVSFNAVDSGKYSVAVTSEGCSKSSSTIALKVNPIPSKPTISLNQAEMISSATTGNQWFSQGNPVQGATAQNFRPTSNGYYTVRSTVNGCVGFMSESFYYLATSVVNLNNDQFIKLFPNPVEDVLKVEYRINHVQPLDLRIFDVAGKLVFEERKLKSGMNLNLSALRSGLYLVRIQKRDGVVLFNDKMIKK